MRNPSGCLKLGTGLALLLGLVAICAFLFFNYSLSRQKEARIQYMPPTVLVTDPVSGTSAMAGSYLNVSATATGTRPIVRVELWLDGQLLETQNSESPEGLAPFYANFAVPVPSEGPHMLFVRAVNATGMIGQSLPVGLMGEPKPADPLLAVTVQEGQSLEDIANAYAADPEALQGLNPGLENQPPAGTVIKVPLKDEPGAPDAAPPAPGNAPLVIPNVPMLPMDTGLPSGQWIAETFANHPPAAPTGLQAEMKGCKITLRWNDNADNEESYKIYMTPVIFHGFIMPFATLKPAPSTGPAWTELEPPGEGSFSLWVEAANSIGEQPSNIVWVYVPFISECPHSKETAKQLSATITDIAVNGNYDKAYCYVSLENQPEQRLPSGDGNFVQLQGGKSQGSYLISFSIPVPGDGVLDLSGKCLGWAGGTLNELGTFSVKYPRETWTGERQVLQAGTYQIGIKLLAAPEWGTPEGIASIDPTLPIPYDLREDPPPNDIWTKSMYPPARLLRWKWDGDPNKIDGFAVFLNGKLIPAWYSLPPKENGQVVQLPGECGAGSVRWQVAARSGTALSGLSAPLQYDLPPCKMYLRVQFENIWLRWTDDGWPSGYACENLDAYYQISVRDVTRSFWGGGLYIPLNCGTHSFSSLAGGFFKNYGAEPHVITIPLAEGEDVYSIWIRAHFWDHDDWSGDDTIGSFAEHPMGAPLIARDGEKWSECKKTYTTGDHITGEAESHITFSFAFYPNACRDTPPETGL